MFNGTPHRGSVFFVIFLAVQQNCRPDTFLCTQKPKHNTMSKQIKEDDRLSVVWTIIAVVLSLLFIGLMIYLGYKLVAFVSGLFGVSMLAALFITLGIEFSVTMILALLGVKFK